MVFVDGENLTIRAQNLAKRYELKPKPGPLYRQDVFIWADGTGFPQPDLGIWHDQWVAGSPLRSSYYTSLTGTHEEVSDVKQALWNLGFQPEVFKRNKPGQKAKGVDIALTKDMLSNAFLGNYDTAILVAGDGDYVPLVQEVKRLGKRVHVCFFPTDGLSPDLKLASDCFIDLTNTFIQTWKR